MGFKITIAHLFNRIYRKKWHHLVNSLLNLLKPFSLSPNKQSIKFNLFVHGQAK